MTNENMPATKDSNLPVTAAPPSMEDMGISAGDLVIPKLLLMQNTSEAVGDGLAKMGDIIRNEDNKVLGGVGAPVEIIPLKLYKQWVIYDMSDSQPKFMRTENVTASNEKLPWEGHEDGKPIRRDMSMNFFVLLKADCDAGEAFPCVVSFRRTGIYAGKLLATHMYKMAAIGKKPYSKSVLLQVRKEKKDTNTYAVYDIGAGQAVTPDAVSSCETWLEQLRVAKVQVKDSGDDVAQEAAKPVAKPVVVESDEDDIKF